jgi:hypothetical protein
MASPFLVEFEFGGKGTLPPVSRMDGLLKLGAVSIS